MTEYVECSRCILSTDDDTNITFDINGVCNYCLEYDKLEKSHVFNEGVGEKLLIQLVDDIKLNGKNKKYDSIIGLSGGVDSSYVALLAKKYGLNPLAVHFDNGWNSELAVKNIENIVSKLGFDLYTYVVDWEEFKDLQLSYLKASVIDIEVLTDHAISTILYKLASKNGIKYILSGTNIVTEGVMPTKWVYNKSDYYNILKIHDKFGEIPLKAYPLHTKFLRFYHKKILKIKSVSMLNYITYNKKSVKEVLKNELNWVDYGGKHFESVFTRFYQGYILPVKFGINKRKAHLSTLICSKQMSKAQAQEEMKNVDYPNELAQEDLKYVVKKLGITIEEFEKMMRLPVVPHQYYGVEKPFYSFLNNLFSFKKSNA